MSQIWIVEDDRTIREAIELILRKEGFTTLSFPGAEEALAHDSTAPDLLICDYRLPGINGTETIRRFKAKNPAIESIVITAFGSIDLAVDAIKQGASDFLAKPFSPEELLLRVSQLMKLKQAQEQNEYLREEVGHAFSDYRIIGSSLEMQKIYALVDKVAPSESTVLIQGESGTGKELIARNIHYHSRRSRRSFVKVNCAALAEGVLESELFGHEKGAFTGSVRQRKGRFELAHRGSIFLDEIGDLAPGVQVKLLRILQEGELERVGGEETLQVDVRIIAATNRNLVDLVGKGLFREDLYYRLNVIPIHLPPLRKRKEDLPELVHFFLERLCCENKRPRMSIDPEAMNAILEYPWPGNVRELENVLERAVVLCDSDHISWSDLPFLQDADPGLRTGKWNILRTGNLDEQLAEVEKQLLMNAMKEANGVKTRASKALGIKTSTLYYKLEKYGLI